MKKIFMFAATVALLASCSNEEKTIQAPKDSSNLEVITKMSGSVTSRALVDAFKDKEGKFDDVAFNNAFNAKDGEGSRKMIWAAKYARELGATKEYVIDLVNNINNYWVIPMDNIRFENTILNQINRWDF